VVKKAEIESAAKYATFSPTFHFSLANLIKSDKIPLLWLFRSKFTYVAAK
jgi:hypothetical protein